MASFGVTARRPSVFGAPLDPRALRGPQVFNPRQLPRGVPVFNPSSAGAVNPDPLHTNLAETVNRGIHHWYDRPISVLGGVARVLGLGENVAVGALKGASSDVGELLHHPARLPWAYFSPWTFIAAHAPNNFRDVASAVKENQTYEEWLRESNDPSSFLYKNAMVIGLGLSIFGDPTTYVSFGTTGLSKTAARKLWVAAANSTADEAITAMKVGKIARTGENVGDFGHSYERVFNRIHTAADRPYTLGDAMETLKQADRGKLPDVDPAHLAEAGVKLKAQPGMYRRVFPRGGQGMRFAGAEIPGTRGLPGKVVAFGERAVGAEPGATRQAALRSFGFLIPQEKLLRVQDDLTRAVAMSEFTRANQTMAFERFGAFEDAAQMFALDANKAAALRAQPGVGRARVAIGNLFNKAPLAVPSNARKGLFREGFKPEGEFKQALEDIRTKGLSTRDEMIEFARLDGLDDRGAKALIKKWDDLAKQYDDPLEVLGRWQASAVGRVTARRLERQIIRNPLLARPYLKDLHDAENMMASITEEQGKVSQRLKEVTEKIARTSPNEKRRLGQLRRIRSDLIDRSGLLASDYNKMAREAKGMHKTAGVRTEEEFRHLFHEDALPFKSEGIKYLVPAPIHHALSEIRNPQHLDQEMAKFLKLINYTQNKWKIAATSLNPSFWWMNAYGGMWNNLLGGVYNPGDYLEQLGDQVRRHLDGMDDGKLAKSLLLRGRLAAPEKMARAKMIHAAGEERQIGGGQVGFEIHPAVQEVKRAQKVPTKAGQALRTARRGFALASTGMWLAPDDWVPDDMENMTIMGVPVVGLTGVAAGLPELTRFGRHMTQGVETMLRETPLRVATKDPTYYQMMDAYSVKPLENFGRTMGQTDIGKTQAARDAIWDIGASMAMRYQFDYTNLTSWERNIAKSIFPFYVFNKNNFVLQAKELINRPRFVATAMDIGNFSNEVTANEQNAAFQELLPEYFDKLGLFRIPVPNALRGTLGIPEGQDVYLNPKLPYSSLNLFPPLWQLFQQDTVTPSNYKMLNVMSSILGMVGPAAGGGPFKPLLEYSVGYNFGLARPIDYQELQSGGWRHSQRDAPGWAKYLPTPMKNMFGIYKDPQTGALKTSASMRYIMDQMATPFMNSAGDVFNSGTTGNEADRIKANNFAFITGIRLTPVDPIRIQRGWLYRMQDMLESQKQNMKAMGGQFPVEDELLLRQIRAQAKVVEYAYDQQQAAQGHG